MIASSEYPGHFPEFSPETLQLFYKDRRQVDVIPVIRLYLAHYKVFPYFLKCQRAELNSLFHIPSILNYLKTEFKHNVINDITRQKYHPKCRQYFVQ